MQPECPHSFEKLSCLFPKIRLTSSTNNNQDEEINTNFHLIYIDLIQISLFVALISFVAKIFKGKKKKNIF